MKLRLAVAAIVFLALGCSAAPPRAPNTYRVPAHPEQLLDDAAAFAKLARELRADLDAEEARGGDTPEQRKSRRFDLALLDGLAGKWDAANRWLDQIVAENPPSWMLGVTIRAWADARGEDPEAFRAALAKRIAAMPYAEVSEQLAVLAELGRALTPATSRSLVAEHVGPAARKGPISRELASAIIFQRWVVLRVAPVGKVIVAVVEAAKPG